MVFFVHTFCPQGHAVLTVAVEGTQAGAVAVDIRATVKTMVKAGTCVRQCARCQAPVETWTTQAVPTQLRTLAEAEAVLREDERTQRVAAALVKGVDDALARGPRKR